jgi:hypothetical protein
MGSLDSQAAAYEYFLSGEEEILAVGFLVDH